VASKATKQSSKATRVLARMTRQYVCRNRLKIGINKQVHCKRHQQDCVLIDGRGMDSVYACEACMDELERYQIVARDKVTHRYMNAPKPYHQKLYERANAVFQRGWLDEMEPAVIRIRKHRGAA